VKHQNDLAILSDNHGEDDMFTRFVTGPLLTFYHRTLGLIKVSMPKKIGICLDIADLNLKDPSPYRSRKSSGGREQKRLEILQLEVD
jgi:hypothetical protein